MGQHGDEVEEGGTDGGGAAEDNGGRVEERKSRVKWGAGDHEGPDREEKAVHAVLSWEEVDWDAEEVEVLIA